MKRGIYCRGSVYLCSCKGGVHKTHNIIMVAIPRACGSAQFLLEFLLELHLTPSWVFLWIVLTSHYEKWDVFKNKCFLSSGDEVVSSTNRIHFSSPPHLTIYPASIQYTVCSTVVMLLLQRLMVKQTETLQINTYASGKWHQVFFSYYLCFPSMHPPDMQGFFFFIPEN